MSTDIDSEPWPKSSNIEETFESSSYLDAGKGATLMLSPDITATLSQLIQKTRVDFYKSAAISVLGEEPSQDDALLWVLVQRERVIRR